AASYNKNGVISEGKQGPYVISLLDDPKITLTCYAGNGMLANGTNALKNSTTNRIKATNPGGELTEDYILEKLYNVSPNDLSLAFVLRYGDFIYFSAGDISGDLSLTRYRNIEEELIAYLNTLDQQQGTEKILGRVSVFKATHHG